MIPAKKIVRTKTVLHDFFANEIGDQMQANWVNYIKIIFLIALGLLIPLSGAMAQDISWQTIRVKSEGQASLCGPGSVMTAYTGNSAAFIFTRLAVNLSATAPHSSGAEFGACRIRSRVIIPKGFYLAGISQNTQAGVVKSVGARGAIHTMLALQSPEKPMGVRTPAFPGLGVEGRVIEQSLKFAPRDEMNEPMLNLSGQYEARPVAIAYQCRFTKKAPAAIDLEFKAAVRGQRKKPGSSVAISVDSSDVQLWIGTRLQACS
jgi:hypothetical protein